MLRLTSLRGSTLPGAPSAYSVEDLVADLAVEPPVVTRVVGQHGADDEDVVTARTEVLLVRDVLDAPGYDIAAARTVRIGEVWLQRLPEGAVVVAGVETDPRGALHRLRPRRRHAARPSTRVVRLADVHLASRHGHDAQLAAAGSAVHHLDEQQLAELLTSLPVELAAEVVRRVPRSRAAVRRLHPQVAARLGRVLGTAPRWGRRRARRTAGWRRHRPGGRPPGGDGGL
jgi:hypothetical protein